MRMMSAGGGCKYLLRSVVTGVGDRSLSTRLVRYYAKVWTPPSAKPSAKHLGCSPAQYDGLDAGDERRTRL